LSIGSTISTIIESVLKSILAITNVRARRPIADAGSIADARTISESGQSAGSGSVTNARSISESG
jgi:hypothetical protein